MTSQKQRARVRFGLMAGASIAACVLAMGSVRAADADTTAETTASDARERIIVIGVKDKGVSSGTKSDTPLMKTPQAITVIDSDELLRRNALSINQAMTYVAGISPNQRGGTVTRYEQMNLRGFTPGFYLDGMRMIAGPYSTPQIDFNRIDHIDVVKGPASVLYGNSTPGGLINLTSKVPEKHAFGRAEIAGGNYNSVRGALDYNQPLDEDGRYLLRVVAGGQRTDGFTDQTQSERYHVSPMLTFSPSEHTSLTLILAYQHDPQGGGYSGVPAFGSALPNPFGVLPRDINTGDPAYERFNRHQRSVGFMLRHDFSDALTFRSNLRFQNTELSYRQLYVAGFATAGTGVNRNTDYSTITRGGGGADEDFDTFTVDNHLNAKFGTGVLEHSVLAGVDYQRITGENFQQFNTGMSANPVTSIPNLSLFNPVYGGTMPTLDLTLLSAAYVNTYTARDQVGVYFQDQVAIGRLQLIASGRYDWYKQDSLNNRNNVTTPLKQDAFTMRLGALYELPFGVSPYFSYSESFEPQAGATYLGVPFVPVTGRQYEAGIKYQPKGTNAIFTLSVYDLRRQNVPVGDPAAGTNSIPTNATIQIGETAIRGLELEGRGEVVPGLDVIMAGTYTDAEVTRGAPASGITPTTTGTRPLGTPEWMASTFVTYDFSKSSNPTGFVSGLTVGGGVRYVGGSNGTTTYAVVNGATTFTAFKTKGFTLVDALVSYDLGRLKPSLEGLSAAVNVANLFNTRHVSACPFANSCYFGAARTVTGTLRYRW